MNHALNHLFTPPFDVLKDAERKTLSQASKITYLPENTDLPDDWRDDFLLSLKASSPNTKMASSWQA